MPEHENTRHDPIVPHHPKVWRTPMAQLADLRKKHEGDPEASMSVLAAETAALLVETMECKNCRDMLPVMVRDIVADPQMSAENNELMASAVIFSLAASVAHADRNIRRGMAAYEGLAPAAQTAAKDIIDAAKRSP